MGIIALTVPEAGRLFRLFATLTADLPPRIAHARFTLYLRWSRWRGAAKHARAGPATDRG